MKKRELHEQIEEIIGKHSWKEWVQPAHPHNVEAATINTTGLNKDLTNFVWDLMRKKRYEKCACSYTLEKCQEHCNRTCCPESIFSI